MGGSVTTTEMKWDDTQSSRQVLVRWEISVLPVGVLCAHVHLQQNALSEGFEALAAFPQMPVTELWTQLTGGGGTRQHALVFRAHLVQNGLCDVVSALVQEREAPWGGRLGKHQWTLQNQRRGFGTFIEGLKRLLSTHGLDYSRRHVYWKGNTNIHHSDFCIVPSLKRHISIIPSGYSWSLQTQKLLWVSYSHFSFIWKLYVQ